MSMLLSLLKKVPIKNDLNQIQTLCSALSIRHKCKDVTLPSNKGHKAGRFRRIVHYPEEYTIKPLESTNLAGRDPETGRVVIKGIGGGIKRKYHWIDWKRVGPKEGPPLVERVAEVMIDWCRTSRIALVVGGKRMRYILATENMKAGDLIKTSGEIPRIPVFANEGDAYPLGALPMGTSINSVEMAPGKGAFYVKAAGTSATILRKVGKRVVIQLPSKLEVSLPQECMATVGRLSNVEHNKTPIGSAQRNRELGNRPRSGLWQRKDGRFGRKIRPPRPVYVVDYKEKETPEVLKLTLNNDMYYNNKLYGHNLLH